MASATLRAIQDWVQAGLIDVVTADRLRAFEDRRRRAPGTRWPVLIAIALGGILLGAGVLLFVSAHWDRLSPAGRFAIVLFMVASFHAAAAIVAARFAALATVLHAVGTIALGAGIFLAGQIFHLQEHWPGGVMLWAAGAWFGWALLRTWSQAALAALLTPAWLVGEWIEATGPSEGRAQVCGQALVILAATYLAARTRDQGGPTRRALTWIGGLALIPCVLFTIAAGEVMGANPSIPPGLLVTGWAAGLGLPLLLAVRLCGRDAWMNVVAAVWAVGLGSIVSFIGSGPTGSLFRLALEQGGIHLWCGLGSIGLIAWGLKEARPERINLGIAGFALTVLFFYFDSVMDKLGRATSLIAMGILFIVVGWILERARRRLIARLKETGP